MMKLWLISILSSLHSSREAKSNQSVWFQRLFSCFLASFWSHFIAEMFNCEEGALKNGLQEILEGWQVAASTNSNAV